MHVQARVVRTPSTHTHELTDTIRTRATNAQCSIEGVLLVIRNKDGRGGERGSAGTNEASDTERSHA
jgi:hypothetical protein